MSKRKRKLRPAERLHAFMQTENLTAATVAEEACMTEARLDEILRDMSTLSMKEALRIRDACGRLLLRYVRFEDVF